MIILTSEEKENLQDLLNTLATQYGPEVAMSCASLLDMYTHHLSSVKRFATLWTMPGKLDPKLALPMPNNMLNNEDEVFKASMFRILAVILKDLSSEDRMGAARIFGSMMKRQFEAALR